MTLIGRSIIPCNSFDQMQCTFWLDFECELLEVGCMQISWIQGVCRLKEWILCKMRKRMAVSPSYVDVPSSTARFGRSTSDGSVVLE
jgi:hypothetical protein